MKLFNLFLGGVIITSLSFYALAPTIRALAHDGISVSPTIPEIFATFPVMSVLYTLLLLLTLGALIIRKVSEGRFSNLLTPFYVVTFTLIFVMTSLSGWRGEFDFVQIFYFVHGFHSIFTLGSVIVLDFLFLLSSHSNVLKQHVYELFPTISKVVWVGLGINFLSIFLILEHFAVTPKFLFVQTVITILIINGVLLSGPVARRMVDSMRNSANHVTTLWRNIGNVAGALSITSWLTISSIDFFDDFTLSFGQLMVAYLTFFVLAFLGHLILEKIEKSRLPFMLEEDF